MRHRKHLSPTLPTETHEFRIKDFRTRSAALRAFLILLASLACLIVPAQAGLLSGALDGTATLTPTGTPGVYIQNFVGDGTDATYGAFTARSQSTVDFSVPPSIIITNGMLTEMFGGGDLFGTGSGTGTALGHGTATFTIDFIIIGGTGIFEHQTGSATIIGTITQTNPTTEAISATYTGNLGTPEPSSLGMLLLGASMGYRFLTKPRG